MAVYKLLGGYASLFEMSSTCCLLSAGGLHVLIDSGSRDKRALLQKKIRASKIRPDEISIILNTHMHMDHCWNDDLFPKADFYCSSREYRTMTELVRLANSNGITLDELVSQYLFLDHQAPYLLKAMVSKFFYEDKVFEKILQRKRVDEAQLQQAGIHVIDTPGHTDGHVAYIYRGRELNYIFTGDAILNASHYGKPLMRILYTKNPDQYALSKLKIEGNRGIYFPGHGHEFQVQSDGCMQQQKSKKYYGGFYGITRESQGSGFMSAED